MQWKKTLPCRTLRYNILIESWELDHWLHFCTSSHNTLVFKVQRISTTKYLNLCKHWSIQMPIRSIKAFLNFHKSCFCHDCYIWWKNKITCSLCTDSSFQLFELRQEIPYSFEMHRYSWSFNSSWGETMWSSFIVKVRSKNYCENQSHPERIWGVQ